MSGTPSTRTTTEPVRSEDARCGPLLGITDEQALLRDYVAKPTPGLEEELVRRFTPLARSLALRYRGGVERTDDLTQVASLALVKALRGYRPGARPQFQGLRGAHDPGRAAHATSATTPGGCTCPAASKSGRWRSSGRRMR